MADTKVADELLDQLSAACHATPLDVDKCMGLLLQLKLQLITFQLVPPFTEPEVTVRKKLLIARETLELGAQLAIDCKDAASFERHFAQLRPYYSDYKHILPVSARQLPLTGASLLCLLSQNRIAEFHAEIELLPTDSRDDASIAFPIEVEQSLMEGSYHKIFNKDVPRKQFTYFMETLVDMVRERVAECSEQAYSTVPASDARDLLLLDSDDKLQAVINERGWDVAGGVVSFPKEADVSLVIPNNRVIEQTLFYATELERIV